MRTKKAADRILNYKFSDVPSAITNCAQRQPQHAAEQGMIEGKLFFYSETGTEGGYWAFQDNSFISLTSPTFGVGTQKVWDINNQKKNGRSSDAEVYLNNEWLPLPDPITKDPDYRISSLFCGEDKGDLLADERLQKRYNFTIKYVVQRMNEEYGINNWKFDRKASNSTLKGGKFNGKIPNVILKDGTLLSVGATPETMPNRPYGIPQNGLTRVTVEWNDGTVEYNRKSNTLLVESWDYKGLHILRNGDYLKILNPINQSSIWSGKIDLIPYAAFTECANGWWIKADQKGISREEWTNYFFDNYPAQLMAR